MPHAATDAIRQRLLPLFGDGNRYLTPAIEVSIMRPMALSAFVTAM
jgi:hypothetical protein